MSLVTVGVARWLRLLRLLVAVSPAGSSQLAAAPAGACDRYMSGRDQDDRDADHHANARARPRGHALAHSLLPWRDPHPGTSL